MKKKSICIACSIFKNTLEAFKDEGLINIPVIYLNSMSHMTPDKLDIILRDEIENHKDYNIIIAFGDCSTKMYDIDKLPNVKRTKGLNCGNILLGAETYKKYRNEGAFILFNEWVHRWREIFQDEFGFYKSETAQLFMKEMHTKFIYLDLGDTEIPHETLKELSDYCGIPYVVESCSSEKLAFSIKSIVQLFEYER